MENKIINGDTLTELKKMPTESVSCVVTSPPYWGLRDYQVEGQIGLEKTLEEYLEKMLAVTAELYRVLRKDGVFWLNHGDCYGGSPPSGQHSDQVKQKGSILRQPKPNVTPKCLCMQNYRLILKMIDTQGWILRNICPWVKGNSMPSSVKDRLANKYEPVFLLVKSQKYFFDLDAIRKPHQKVSEERVLRARSNKHKYIEKYGGGKGLNKSRPNRKTKIIVDTAELFNSPKARYHREGNMAISAYQYGEGDYLVTNLHPSGKNPGDCLYGEEINDFPIFAVERHTIVLGVKEFEDFSNFVSVVVNKFIDSSFAMPLGDDDTDITGLSENMRDFRQKLLSSRPMQPNLISVEGNPYATITIKQSPNEIKIEFGRNKWIFRNESFSNRDTPLDKIKSHLFAINTKRINTPFFVLMNWMSGLPLSFDIINQLNIFRSKSNCITFSSFYNTTITKKQAQDISRMMSNFAKVFFVESLLTIAFDYCRVPMNFPSIVMNSAKTASIMSSVANITFPHIINITHLAEKVKEKSDVFFVNTQPFKENHFATFPEKLIEPLIMSGCPKEICKKCGKARVRISESNWKNNLQKNKEKNKSTNYKVSSNVRRDVGIYNRMGESEHKTIGWTRCNCKPQEYESGIVLDPFGGAMTTALVAKKLGRKWIMIELSPKYCKMGDDRLRRKGEFLNLGMY